MTTPATTPNWINLLISLGASLGDAFIKSTAIGNLVNIAATTTEGLITQIGAAKAASAAPGAGSASLVVPIFVSVLQAAIAVALAENKLTAAEAKSLSDALTAMGQEDVIAQRIVDYTKIGPIAPLP